ncbi:MAG: hypothetical protein MJ252_19435 [archaeon]|nr:hypothetical protein [archaeon]
MLEKILGRRINRTFLKLYNSERWSEIVPTLCEIAVLNLYTSFKTLTFSRGDFEKILMELKKGSDYERMSRHQSKKNLFYETPSCSTPVYSGRSANDYYDKDEYANAPKVMRDFKAPTEKKGNFSNGKMYYYPGRGERLNMSEVERENNSNRRKLKETESRIKYQVDNDRRVYSETKKMQGNTMGGYDDNNYNNYNNYEGNEGPDQGSMVNRREQTQAEKEYYQSMDNYYSNKEETMQPSDPNTISASRKNTKTIKNNTIEEYPKTDTLSFQNSGQFGESNDVFKMQSSGEENFTMKNINPEQSQAGQLSNMEISDGSKCKKIIK